MRWIRLFFGTPFMLVGLLGMAIGALILGSQIGDEFVSSLGGMQSKIEAMKSGDK